MSTDNFRNIFLHFAHWHPHSYIRILPKAARLYLWKRFGAVLHKYNMVPDIASSSFLLLLQTPCMVAAEVYDENWLLVETNIYRNINSQILVAHCIVALTNLITVIILMKTVEDKPMNTWSKSAIKVTVRVGLSKKLREIPVLPRWFLLLILFLLSFQKVMLTAWSCWFSVVPMWTYQTLKHRHR